MEQLVKQLSEYTDTELLNLLLLVKGCQSKSTRAKTNRFGVHKKLPKGELDIVVAMARALKKHIRKLEKDYTFEKGEIMNQIVSMLNI
jgi:hypothetical protein